MVNVINLHWHYFESHQLDHLDHNDDDQVDAYRDSGKEEAAIRLEEQLSLIHTRFQVALFTLFILIIIFILIIVNYC